MSLLESGALRLSRTHSGVLVEVKLELTEDQGVELLAELDQARELVSDAYAVPLDEILDHFAKVLYSEAPSAEPEQSGTPVEHHSGATAVYGFGSAPEVAQFGGFGLIQPTKAP